MVTKFKLLQSAQSTANELINESNDIVKSLQTVNVLAETVMHVLANVATKAEEGQDISAASADSIAAFLAGVEAIATRLPNSSNNEKKQTIMRKLAVCGINPDGTLSTNCVPIAEIGSSFPELRRKYSQLINSYELSIEQGRPNGSTLVRSVRSLQQILDRAIRTSTVIK